MHVTASHVSSSSLLTFSTVYSTSLFLQILYIQYILSRAHLLCSSSMSLHPLPVRSSSISSIPLYLLYLILSPFNSPLFLLYLLSPSVLRLFPLLLCSFSISLLAVLPLQPTYFPSCFPFRFFVPSVRSPSSHYPCSSSIFSTRLFLIFSTRLFFIFSTRLFLIFSTRLFLIFYTRLFLIFSTRLFLIFFLISFFAPSLSFHPLLLPSLLLFIPPPAFLLSSLFLLLPLSLSPSLFLS